MVSVWIVQFWRNTVQVRPVQHSIHRSLTFRCTFNRLISPRLHLSPSLMEDLW